MSKTKVYVLKLENDKYYVGRSNNVDNRICQHFANNGPLFTKINKPISIEKIYDNCDDYDEDKYTKMYMNIYGIDNVRGGSYIFLQFPQEVRKMLEKEFKTANNQCFRCGRNSHYINNCYAKTDINGNLLNDVSKIVPTMYRISSNEMLIYKSKRPCVGCGSTSHKIDTCDQYINKSVCYRCGREDHWKMTCIAEKDKNGYELESHIIGTIGNFFKSFI
jgi:hypothetical protein